MEDFNIKEVDFYNLDIDKYVDWLLDRYKIFATIWELPYLDDIIINLHYRNYILHSHYLTTRGERLPEKFEKMFERKIKHFESQTEKYKLLKHELIFFESVEFEKEKGITKKYGFFSKKELENIKIDIYWLRFWLEKQRESNYNDLIDQINERKKATPLKDHAFYQKELSNLLQEFEFKYLPEILDGKFIYNLDNDTNSFAFALEIDKIRVAVYLSEMIKGETIHHPLTKPLKWKGQINTFVTLFIELQRKEAGMLDGTNENIKRLLLNNFVDSEGNKFSKAYIDDIFKPMKGKTDAKAIENLKPFLSYLTENSPEP
ncbi:MULTISPECIES: hypothetical protein [unclassified Chryseobacterium]|uniref:hypothetical protein n=1 Tax=unclassified Chryseobacterium TaxID=2593645 RepID=UPI000D3AB06E|nr:MULTISPECIES: hypothetical protein [unclassified Chryseobacterium]PTT77198.1 hypothetical protein DBR25_03840 [Chryseobacterium sp. HMWF001]PVV54805.1 hypothetical protein DD829_16425 [Chryseobacterium sp. HMWF035]